MRLPADRAGLGEPEREGRDPLDLRQDLPGSQAARGHEGRDLPRDVGAGEHRPALPRRPDRLEPPGHIHRGRRRHHPRQVASTSTASAKRCLPVTPGRPGDSLGKGPGRPGKGPGKGSVRGGAVPGSGVDPGTGRGGPDGGQDGGQDLVAADPA